ncbi:MAG TPA: hypothetical protein VE953_06165 [Terriglobales bacterium]|nr:hypothetical protein [Terriglobales bacterium]
MISVRAPSRLPVRAPALVGLAAAGAAAAALVLAAPALPFGGVLHLAPAGRLLLAASAAALALTTALAPHRVGRRELLAAGLGALGGQALLMALTDPLAIAIVLLLIGLGFAARGGARPFVERARPPAFAALLIGAGWAFVQLHGATWVGRAGALAIALGLAATAGLVPYLAPVDSEEPASSSFVIWTGFFGPALAISLPGHVLPGMPAGEASVFGATLVGLGLVNLGWGTIGAWRTASEVEAWRCSFLVDWGFALVGIGLFLPDGLAAALLALLAIVLVRVPLYLWARPALLGAQPARLTALNVLLAVLLTGAAPFSGFPVRLLVLGAATQTAWPLAIPLLVAMLLAVTYSVRLARALGSHRRWAAAGLWITLGLGLVLGLAPAAVRSLGGI